MKFERVTNKRIHNRKHIPTHRVCTGEFKIHGQDVCLIQLEPKGLWWISGVFSNDYDALYDEHYGGMPFRLALVKLRLGV